MSNTYKVLVTGDGLNSVSALRAIIEERAKQEQEQQQLMKDRLTEIRKGLDRQMEKHIPAPAHNAKVAISNKPRHALKKVKNTWIEIPFMELTSGCTFRMLDDEGKPIIDEKGRSEWIAAGKPFIKEGVETIDVYR